MEEQAAFKAYLEEKEIFDGYEGTIGDIFPEVWNQYDAPLCAAYTAAQMMTILYLQTHKKCKNFVLSPQELVNGHCKRIYSIIECLTEKGLCRMKDQQFMRMCIESSRDLGGKRYRLSGYAVFKTKKLIAYALIENFTGDEPHRPVYGGCEMYDFMWDDSLTATKTNPFSHKAELQDGENPKNHAMLITGIYIESVQPLKIHVQVKNAHGLHWGTGGYAWVVSDFFKRILIPQKVVCDGEDDTNPYDGAESSEEEYEGGFSRRSPASRKKRIADAPAAKKAGPTKTTTGKRAGGTSKKRRVEVEPKEMCLEEIQSRIGSLIQEATIPRLKSTAWKKRLEAITSFKAQVEALQELDESVEVLIRLLCAVPGWTEKNVKVQRQVIEVVNHIASSASKFPKECVVLCIEGICERVADIKTRAQAMKCLTTFCEAVGPSFVYERMFKVMKEHKNPTVVSEGLLWMHSAIEGFGVPYWILKDVFAFCKDTGLRSSDVPTRNATFKLIGTLHKYVGPDIKGFLYDVKPTLLSAVEAECEKNPFEGAPKKTVKPTDSVSSSSDGGLDSLPREDISGKITPALLKGLESSDRKMRFESIQAVNKIVEEANKRIQPTGTVGLFRVLRARLHGRKKKLIMATLISISSLASAMGPAIETASKGILSDVVKCLGGKTKRMRECTLTTLDSWVAATRLDKMMPYITASLTDAKLGAKGRKDLFDWLSKQLTGLAELPDAIQLLRPVAVAMMDKSADARKAAEVCFGNIVRVCGTEMVMKNARDIQGPALEIVLDRLKSHGAFP